MSQASTFGFPRVGPAPPVPHLPLLDDSLKALLSQNSGSSPPAYAVKATFWADTATSGFVTLKVYDGTDWIPLCIVEESTNYVRWYENNPEISVASASTVDFLAIASNNIVVTGNTTISSFGTAPKGVVKNIRFSSSLQIVNSSSIITPAGSDIFTSPNDRCVAVSSDSGNWRIVQYSIAVQSSLPVGMTVAFPSPSPPSGWLKANGAAVSRTVYSPLFNYLVTSSGFTPQSVTIATGTPAVFTKLTHGFSGGERLRFSTTGALPTGISSGLDYYVNFISTNTFSVSTLIGGTAITATGTQSGTHSYIQSYFGLGDGTSTFNIPDLRGEFIRGWDDGRGIDGGRTFGSAQLDAFQGHKHGFDILNNYMTDQPGGSGQTAGGGGRFAAPVIGSATNDGTNGTPRVASETRPRNIALLACIKY